MTSFIVAYLFGAFLGEVILLALWAMKQVKAVSPADYLRTKWAQALLSASVALVGCWLTAEGTLVKFVVDHTSWDIEQTLGFSVAAGASVAVFAHSIVSFLAKRLGVEPPTEAP